MFPLAWQLAALQVDMHSRSASNLPSSQEALTRKIQNAPPLDKKKQKAVIDHLKQLPQSDKLLHGDFHPDNIMLTDDGPVIIDWIDATMGHPMADVARTSLLARVGLPPPKTITDRVFHFFVELHHRIYINHYFKLSPFIKEDLIPWLLPVTAGQLSEEIEHETDVLVGLVGG